MTNKEYWNVRFLQLYKEAQEFVKTLSDEEILKLYDKTS